MTTNANKFLLFYKKYIMTVLSTFYVLQNYTLCNPVESSRSPKLIGVAL